MSAPLFSVYILEVFPRAIIARLTSMASNIVEEDLTSDFGLQILLEGCQDCEIHQSTDAVSLQHRVLEELHQQMLPQSIILQKDDSRILEINSSRQCDDRQLLSMTEFGNSVHLELDRNYTAFQNASEYYIYYVIPVQDDLNKELAIEDNTSEETPNSLKVAIAVRYPWLTSSLKPGMLWESTAYSFSRLTCG